MDHLHKAHKEEPLMHWPGETSAPPPPSRKRKDTYGLSEYHLIWLQVHTGKTSAWLRKVLSMGFDVHHVDGNHANNDPTNLVLIEYQDHALLHQGKRPQLGRVNSREVRRHLDLQPVSDVPPKGFAARWKWEQDRKYESPMKSRQELRQLEEQHRRKQGWMP